MKQNESKQPDTKILEEEAQARRDFLKRAAAVGVVAPPRRRGATAIDETRPSDVQWYIWRLMSRYADWWA